MEKTTEIRWGLLRFVYAYTVIGAGGFGLAILVAPGLVRSLFRMPEQDPYVFGIAGSIWLAFGLLSVLGLRSPLRFLPVLLLQFCYKSLWLIGVVLPLMLRGGQPLYGFLFTAVMVSYVALDLVAIPFPYLFSREPAPDPAGV
jgi:hypothetical protein